MKTIFGNFEFHAVNSNYLFSAALQGVSMPDPSVLSVTEPVR